MQIRDRSIVPHALRRVPLYVAQRWLNASSDTTLRNGVCFPETRWLYRRKSRNSRRRFGWSLQTWRKHAAAREQASVEDFPDLLAVLGLQLRQGDVQLLIEG